MYHEYDVYYLDDEKYLVDRPTFDFPQECRSCGKKLILIQTKDGPLCGICGLSVDESFRFEPREWGELERYEIEDYLYKLGLALTQPLKDEFSTYLEDQETRIEEQLAETEK